MNWRISVLVAAVTVVVAVASFWLGASNPFGDGLASGSAGQSSAGVGALAQKASAPAAAVATAPDSVSPRVLGAPASQQLSAEQRRERSAQVRSEMSALLAKSGSVSPEQAIALIDELERLTPGSAEATQLRSLKSMLENTSKIQTLNAELQRLSSSTASEDVKRRQAILVELRQLSEVITATAAEIQARVPAASAAGSGR